MIDYVNVQLSAWGKWSARNASKGMGYSPICPMFKQAQHGGAFGSSIPVGVDVSGMDHIRDTDEAVRRLDSASRALCIECYVVRGSSEEIAHRMGVTKKTIYNRIDALHQKVLGLLNDVVAGC